MKLLAIILSVYFLGLNFVPCDDTIVTDDQEEVSVSTSLEQEQQESDEHNGTDDCPPFCQCHCCHVHVVKFNPSTFEVFEPRISFLAPLLGESAGKDIADFHFQPPRI